MIRHISGALAAALCVLGIACSPGADSGTPLALVGGRINPSPDAEPIDDGVVLIEDGRIASECETLI